MSRKAKFRPKYKLDNFIEKAKKKLISHYRKKYINKMGKR